VKEGEKRSGAYAWINGETPYQKELGHKKKYIGDN